VLLNTHLHSDHCGGNALLQSHFPQLCTLIPPGLSGHVRHWDPDALTYTPTGQVCPPFQFNQVLVPGTEILLGDLMWQVHAAPGHDTHSVILFEPASRLLVSADALWERGFGVIFPELDGVDAFTDAGKTIDLIESLRPTIVIPGHGPAFSCVEKAIANARARLDGFVANPVKHAQYAVKVLLKFKLLELQSLSMTDFSAWIESTAYFRVIHAKYFSEYAFGGWIDGLMGALVHTGAASRDGLMVRNQD
jgi:glyoxylase-like metal-dependent hydrolase (beta-lactamase superfamily II)